MSPGSPRVRGPRLRLWSLTRHPTVTIHAVQSACPSFAGCAHNRLAQVASGDCKPEALSDAQRREVLRALVALGLANRGDEAGLRGWLEPLTPAEVRRLLRRPRHGAVRGSKAKGVGEGAFRAFTGAAVGKGCWDHWKKETRPMLTQDVLDHFGLKADPFEKPRSPEERWTCAALERCEKQLRTSVLRGEFTLVMGPSGCGKTQLARATVRKLEDAGKVVVSRHLAPDKRRISEFSLVAGLASDLSDRLGLGHRMPTSTVVAMRRLVEAAGKAHKTGRMILLLVEEAHCLRDEIGSLIKRLMEALQEGYEERMATLFLGQTDPSAYVFGRPLTEVIADPDNREWVQRLTIIDVPPLGQSLASYVDFRFTQRGAPTTRVFDEGWQLAVRRALPREQLVPQAVDRLLSDAMRHAHRMGDRKAGPAHIDDAALTGRLGRPQQRQEAEAA